MKIFIKPCRRGKVVADVEIEIGEDLKLDGFSIWEGDDGPYVTFPGRIINVRGHEQFRQSIRSTTNTAEPLKKLKEAILSEWRRR